MKNLFTAEFSICYMSRKSVVRGRWCLNFWHWTNDGSNGYFKPGTKQGGFRLFGLSLYYSIPPIT